MFAFIVGAIISLLSFVGLLAFCAPQYDRVLQEVVAMPLWMAAALAISNGVIVTLLLRLVV